MANDTLSGDNLLRNVQAFVAEKWQPHHPCDRCGAFHWSILPGNAAVLLEVTVDEIRTDLRAIRIDLAEIKGKLSNIPTTFQLVFMQAGLILAIFAGVFGLVFGLLKLASSH